ncbi:MAG TPA: ATP-binding protein [Methylomirabilota bacterium]|jgi:signal transduction histidine kinase
MLGRGSLLRTFALLSFLLVALITIAQVGVQWRLLREDLLEWERTSTAEAIRVQVASVLDADDFVHWNTPAARARFSEFLRLALSNPEILRIKLYDPEMRVVWSDEPRLLGERFEGKGHLARALGGETVALLEEMDKAENEYERDVVSVVELYVPIVLHRGRTPGTAAVDGVVEIYKDPSRRFANYTRDRMVIMTVSLLGALTLYTGLFWIVRQAARRMEAQQRDLARQADTLRTTSDELAAAQKQLRVSERLAAVGEVSAAVAHGIRNPLASIRASAQVAADGLDDRSRVETYLRAITDEVDRLGRWLTSLLDSVRPFQLDPGPVDLNGLLRDLLGVLQRRLAVARVTVDARLAPDLPKLHADEVQLQQAFLGVLENAIEALPSGGTICLTTELAAEPEPPTARVTVRDTGAGISPERLPHVFEVLYSTKSRGTGLGLAITRKVVERHGGHVDIESAPGEGTTVTVRLPLQAEETPA